MKDDAEKAAVAPTDAATERTAELSTVWSDVAQGVWTPGADGSHYPHSPNEQSSVSFAGGDVYKESGTPAKEVVRAADGSLSAVEKTGDGGKKVYGLNAQGQRDGSEMDVNSLGQVTDIKWPNGTQYHYNYGQNGQVESWMYTSPSGSKIGYHREGNTNYWSSSTSPGKLQYMELHVDESGLHIKSNTFPNGTLFKPNGTRANDNPANYSGEPVQPDIAPQTQGDQQQPGVDLTGDKDLRQAQDAERQGFTDIQNGNWNNAYAELMQAQRLYQQYWQKHPATGEVETQARQKKAQDIGNGIRLAVQGMQMQQIDY